MRHRVMAVLFAAGLLGGCTDADWDNTFSYAGFSQKPAPEGPPQAYDSEPAPANAPAPAVTSAPAPAADTWCIDVAKSARAEAANQGFDGATQQRRALAAFNQCSRYRAQ